jgi:tRNA dimethylallyltransferase
MGCDRNMVSMQGIGYKELLACLDGEMTIEEAVSLIQKESRHFAKRQLTWFRREKEVIWLDRGEFQGEEAILDEMQSRMKQKGIL